MRAAKTKTEIRHEQIAQAALRLIARRGFHHLNVAAVAREVGVVPSAIYRHYRGKDEVLDAVLDLVSQRLLGNVDSARQAAANAPARLGLLLGLHAQLIQNDVPVPRVVFSEEIFTGNPARRRRVQQIFQEYLAQVAQLIREGQRDGEIRREFPAGTLAMMFLGLIQPAAMLWLMSGGKSDFSRRVRNSWQVFWRMISPQTGAKATASGTRKRRPARARIF